jgi:hypothetical protein
VTCVAGVRFDADFGGALLSLFGGAGDGPFASSAGAAGDLATSALGGADFSSAPFEASTVTVGAFALDPADVGAGEGWDGGDASMRVSVSFISVGPPKNL